MEQKNAKNQFKKMLMVFTTLLICLVVFVTVMFIYKAGEINAYTILSIIIAFLILALALYFVVKRKKEIEQGIPQHEERSRKIMNLAASRAFYISIYWLLFLMWLSDVFKIMPTDAVLGVSIGGMTIIWVICQLWYNKFGDKHI